MATAELLLDTLRLHPRTDPDDLVRAWSETSPAGLYALADYERAATLFLRRLEETEADAAAPAEFVAPLRRHTASSDARNQLVDTEAGHVVDFLAAERIPCVLLKGIARRAAGPLLPCGDARSAHDIDILVPPGDVDRAWTGLREAGYEHTDDEVPRHHAPSLESASGIKVEIHTSLSQAIDPAEAWRRANDDAREIAWNGRRVMIQAPTEMLWHGITHALAHGTRAWRLRFFLDAASVLAADEPVAWEIIGRRLDGPEIPPHRAARRWLAASAQLAGTDLPPGITRGERRFDLARILRWRLSVLRDRGVNGFGGRLLEEGLRDELGYGLAPRVAGTGLYRRTRRRLGGLAARMVYGVWRVTGARAMRI